MPAEGRHAAICHGLCPVARLVFLVAAALWIMTPVGRRDAVWQPCWGTRLPGRSRCLDLNFKSSTSAAESGGAGAQGTGGNLKKSYSLNSLLAFLLLNISLRETEE